MTASFNASMEPPCAADNKITFESAISEMDALLLPFGLRVDRSELKEIDSRSETGYPASMEPPSCAADNSEYVGSLCVECDQPISKPVVVTTTSSNTKRYTTHAFCGFECLLARDTRLGRNFSFPVTKIQQSKSPLGSPSSPDDVT